jgi:hypothetical protein
LLGWLLLLLLLYLLLLIAINGFSCCKSISYMRHPHFGLLSNSSAFYKNNKSLNSGNPIAFSTNLCNLNIIFLATLNRLWTTEAAASSKSSSSSVRHPLS